jgi:tellurite resistance protein
MPSTPTISHHTALIYIMVIAAVADGALKDRELATIGEFVGMLPVFRDYDKSHTRQAVNDCTSLLDQDDGLDVVLGLARKALPVKLRETAYALACDIVAVDGEARQEELRWLEMLRHGLEVERLHAAAIERGSRARYAHL